MALQTQRKLRGHERQTVKTAARQSLAHTNWRLNPRLVSAMFLKIHHDDDSSLVEILDVKRLFDAFSTTVAARLHGGEEMQDPQAYAKVDLFFPSGESLLRCWA